jgi:hypothetical protein
MRATRPVTISFIEGDSCTFDSNEFVEWEILTHDLPMADIVFKGSPFTDTGLSELGRCTFDYCDHGLYIYQELCNRLYEAQHPWLDVEDALKKGVLQKGEDYHTFSQCATYCNQNIFTYCDQNIFTCEENTLPIVWTAFKDKASYRAEVTPVAFKPLSPLEWIDFQGVEVYTPQ